jgi:hypothetical protein
MPSSLQRSPGFGHILGCVEIRLGDAQVSHDAAITILKAASSGRNKKLADVAAAVITSIGQQLPHTHFSF